MSVLLSVEAMSCRFELALEGDDPVRLRSAGEEAISEIDALDRQLSRFRPESDVSWINARAAKEPVKVEPRLFRLLQRAKEISDATGGAFDITVAPLIRVWGFTENECRVPQPEEIEQARSVVGMQHVILDEAEYAVRFDKAGVEIDLGAIGKGYAIERAVECLRDAGITRALLHGGTSTAFGIGKWEMRIAEPPSCASEPNHKSQIINHKSVVPLHDSSLSVSAVHGRSFTEGGREYGHVIDPRTGEPVFHTLLAAVWGPSPTDCDALSTALLVLGENWLPEMRARFVGCNGLA